MFAAADLVVPGPSDVIQFVLVAVIACTAIGGARFIRARRAAQAADSGAQTDHQRVRRPRPLRARVWAGVGSGMTAYAGAMLAGSIALGDGVQPAWVGVLVVGVGCVAWSSRLRRQHSSQTP
jgi:hypothetical protein